MKGPGKEENTNPGSGVPAHQKSGIVDGKTHLEMLLEVAGIPGLILGM